MMPLWVLELAETFWSAVGGPGPYPRCLRAALNSGAFDVTVRERPGLSIRGVENYLAHQGIFRTSGEPERPLRACVTSQGGAAWIFLDRDDSPEQKTASLAHELAHFLRHALQPRRRAAARGGDLLAVLDGHRAPTHGEQVRALLRGLSLDPHVHYLRRDGSTAERLVEEEAERLSWHLLAPCAEVRARLVGDEGGFDRARAVLTQTFGLPAAMAADYADFLYPQTAESPVANKLKGIVKASRTPRIAQE